MSKQKEIRCSQFRQKRDGQKVLCNRFLGLMDENGSIRVVCPCCGTPYLLVPMAEVGPKAIRLVDEPRPSTTKG